MKEYVLEKFIEAGLVDEQKILFNTAWQSKLTETGFLTKALNADPFAINMIYGGYAAVNEQGLHLVEFKWVSKKKGIEKILEKKITITKDVVNRVYLTKQWLGMTLHIEIGESTIGLTLSKKQMALARAIEEKLTH